RYASANPLEARRRCTRSHGLDNPTKPSPRRHTMTPSSNRLDQIARLMCRMMGVVSQGPVYYDLFEEFADLATQGMCPIGAPVDRGHKDGWGLACFQNGERKGHRRDAGAAV